MKKLYLFTTLLFQLFIVKNALTQCTPPAAPFVNGATINCGDPATLTASGSTGNFEWFSDANGNNSIGTGNSISLGNLYANSTVYVAATSGSAATSSQLGTTQSGGNGCGGGNMFDITTNSALNLTGFTVTPNTTGTQNVVIYYKAGSYNGFQTNQGAWTNAGTYTINGTNGAPTLINLNTLISLNGNSTYGIYVQYSAQYTTGANTYSNADITITTGMGHCSPFDGCCSPRTFNGIVHYQIGSAGCLSNLVPVTAIVNGANPPTANGITINCGDPATLTASGSTGNYEWYSDSNGNNSIGTGNSISLGNLFADSTVYVAAASGSQPGPPAVIYTEDWQGGNGGWTLGNAGPYWNRINGGTTSTGTGPNGGSTNGVPTNGNFYVYLETSSGSTGQTAYLTGPGFTITGSATLEFDYHMYGATMGTLAVEVFDGTSWMQVWSLSGQQQTSNAASWTTVSVPLTNYTGSINIRFSGQRGSSFTGDMAIDNISISEAQSTPACLSSLVPATVTVNPTPGPTVSGNTSICGSGSTTLTATGTGNSIEWYSDPGGTNLIANGSSFTTPFLTNNTTYYVGEVPASVATTYNQTIVVQGGSGLSVNNTISFPGTPTGATGNPTLIITVYGDIDGIGTNLEQWRIDDENGIVLGTAGGTGNFNDQCATTITTSLNLTPAQIDAWAASGSINFTALDPTGNINYTLCGNDFVQLQLIYDYGSGSSCKSALTPVNVTIDQPSIVATGISGTGSTCFGSTATLTVQGGTLNGSSNWQWFSGSCASTLVGTGPSITVTPTSTTTYFVQATANGACPATTCTSGTVTLPTPNNTLSVNNSTGTCTVNQNGWVHFLDANGRIVASVNSNGQNLGVVTATSYVDNASQLIVPCSGNTNFSTSVLRRHWVITPQFQPTSPVSVRLPVDWSVEWPELQIESQANVNILDDCVIPSDVVLSKFAGNNVDNLWTNNCGNGNTSAHNQVTNGFINSLLPGFNGVDRFFDFEIPSFSEFWLHGSNSGNSPLPVEMSLFTVTCDAHDTKVVWQTQSEINSSHFLLEKSIDGTAWESVATIQAAQNSSTPMLYSSNHPSTNNEHYYRLIQVDLDGQFEIYGPIVANCTEDKASSEAIYPNPSNGHFSVALNNYAPGNGDLVLINSYGQTVLRQQINIESALHLSHVFNHNLANGLYYVFVSINDVSKAIGKITITD